MDTTIRVINGVEYEIKRKPINYDRKVTVKFNSEFYEKCKAYADDKGISFAALLRRALENEMHRGK